MRARNVSGTWIRNTQCQLDTALMVLPMIGPNPKPMPLMMPQVVKAMPRSCSSWYWCEMMAMVQVNIAPPARPCRNRAAISTDALCASPHISDVMPKATVLVMKTSFRPYRSAKVPVAISTVVQAMV